MSSRTLARMPAVLLAINALALVLLPASAAPTHSAHSMPRRPPTSRKTTEPPIPAQGKLGQDLFMAIGRGNLAGVQELLARGADPSARNGLMFTPMDLAAATGQIPVMEALLKAGAELDSASPYGTPLMFAAGSGIPPAMQFLMSRGANVNAVRGDGISVLMLASRAGIPPPVSELIARKARVNARDDDGATPLIFAAREGHEAVGRILLAAGAAVDKADSHHWTPLMYAAVNGHAGFVRLLLEKGARTNARDARGRTPLILAATYGDNPEVITALKKAGADFHAVNERKQTAYIIASLRGHADCASVMGSGGAVQPSARSARAAVNLSLTALQHSMAEFSRQTNCISCHQEGLGRITTGAALDRGFRINSAVDHAQRDRIHEAITEMAPLHFQALKDPEAMKQVPLIEIGEVTTVDAFLLAGMAAHKQPRTREIGAMAMVLARQQMPDGSWGFALPRPPMQSSFFTFTALTIRSLREYAPLASRDEIAGRVRLAKNWLLTAPTKSTEDLTFRLLGLAWAGANAGEKQKAFEELRAAQRQDGGWAQLPGMHSDAYATGEALYALHTAGGLAATDPAYRRGVRLLLRTQDDDGSWFVNKRTNPANNYLDAGFPHGESQYSSFNGTCWATMALLQTIHGPQFQAFLPVR